MNERIRKLAIDAGGHGLKMSTIGLSLLGEKQIQQFAELIVRECMTLCEDVTERNDPAIACYYEIKKHFGVE